MSRKPQALLVAVTVIAALGMSLAACALTDNNHLRVGSGPYEQGSGTVATETRPLADFHAVSATRGVTVFVSTGDSPAATVSADDNLLAHVITTVSDGTLVVAIEGDIETHSPLSVDVTTISPIDGLSADAGSTVDCEDLRPASLEVRASSGSTVRAGGQADMLVLKANTGSTVDLRNLEATEAQVDVSVGSTAHVNATDVVRGSCTMGSTLQLHGTPATLNVAADAGSSIND